MILFPEWAWAVATIWGEARGESHHGRLAVAEVLRNRTRARYFSDGTVVSTCLWPLQFSCWNLHDPNRLPMARLDDNDSMVRDCALAWDESVGTTMVRGALLYYNPAIVTVAPKWATDDKFVTSVDHHRFYNA